MLRVRPLTLGTLTVRYPTTLTAIPNPLPCFCQSGRYAFNDIQCYSDRYHGKCRHGQYSDKPSRFVRIYANLHRCGEWNLHGHASIFLRGRARCIYHHRNLRGNPTFGSSTANIPGTLTVRYPTLLEASTNPLTASVSVNPGEVDALSFDFSVTATGTTVNAGTVNIQATPAGLFASAPFCDVASGACTAEVSIHTNAAPGVYTVTATYAGNDTLESITTPLTLGTLTVRYLSSYQAIFNYCDSTTPTPICYLVVEVASTVPSTLTPFSSTDQIEVKITPPQELKIL